MEIGIEQSEKGAKSIWSIGLCGGGVGYKVDKFSHPLSTTSKMTKLTNKKVPLPSFPSITQGIFFFSQVLYIKREKKNSQVLQISFVAKFSLSFYRKDEGFFTYLGPPRIERQNSWREMDLDSNTI